MNFEIPREHEVVVGEPEPMLGRGVGEEASLVGGERHAFGGGALGQDVHAGDAAGGGDVDDVVVIVVGGAGGAQVGGVREGDDAKAAGRGVPLARHEQPLDGGRQPQGRGVGGVEGDNGGGGRRGGGEGEGEDDRREHGGSEPPCRSGHSASLWAGARRGAAANKGRGSRRRGSSWR